jgi:hypothetical protein
LTNTEPTRNQANLQQVQHPVPIKLEYIPADDNSDINTGIDYYCNSNNLSNSDNSSAYPVSPHLPDEGQFAMFCMKETKSLDNDQPNSLLPKDDAQEDDPPQAYRPRERMLPALFPDPPYRPDDNLSKTHLNPFQMFQEEAYNPPAELSFPDATLPDDNGPICLRDLPICVNTSITVASFRLNFLDVPPVVNHIRDLNRRHLFWCLTAIITRSKYITRRSGV